MMFQEDDDGTLNLGKGRRKQKRRSSILKPMKSPSRNALGDLDLNGPPSDDDLTIRRKSRRVSFCETYQVKEFKKESPHQWMKKFDDGSTENSTNPLNQGQDSQIAGLDNLLTGPIKGQNEHSDQNLQATDSTNEKIDGTSFLANLNSKGTETSGCIVSVPQPPLTDPELATMMNTSVNKYRCSIGASVFSAAGSVLTSTSSMMSTTSGHIAPSSAPVASNMSYGAWDNTTTKVYGNESMVDRSRPANAMNVFSSSDKTQVFGDENTAGMEFTTCIPGAVQITGNDNAKENLVERTYIFDQEDTDAEMDFTVCHNHTIAADTDNQGSKVDGKSFLDNLSKTNTKVQQSSSNSDDQSPGTHATPPRKIDGKSFVESLFQMKVATIKNVFETKSEEMNPLASRDSVKDKEQQPSSSATDVTVVFGADKDDMELTCAMTQPLDQAHQPDSVNPRSSGVESIPSRKIDSKSFVESLFQMKDGKIKSTFEAKEDEEMNPLASRASNDDTVVFGADRGDMEFTCNMMQPLKQGHQADGRPGPDDKTIVFNTNDDCDMDFTGVVPELITTTPVTIPQQKSSNRTVVFDLEPTIHCLSPLQQSSIRSETSHINESTQQAGSKTVLFDKTSADMEFTSVGMPTIDLLATASNSAKFMESRKKTNIENSVRPDKTVIFDERNCDMEMTNVSIPTIPSDTELRKSDKEVPKEQFLGPLHKSSASLLPIQTKAVTQQNLGTTVMFDQTAADMEFTNMLTTSVKNVSEHTKTTNLGGKTILFDETSAAMELTGVVPSLTSKSLLSKTALFDKTAADMELTNVAQVDIHIAQETTPSDPGLSKTVVFDKNSDDMEFTTVTTTKIEPFDGNEKHQEHTNNAGSVSTNKTISCEKISADMEVTAVDSKTMQPSPSSQKELEPASSISEINDASETNADNAIKHDSEDMEITFAGPNQAPEPGTMIDPLAESKSTYLEGPANTSSSALSNTVHEDAEMSPPLSPKPTNAITLLRERVSKRRSSVFNSSSLTKDILNSSNTDNDECSPAKKECQEKDEPNTIIKSVDKKELPKMLTISAPSELSPGPSDSYPQPDKISPEAPMDLALDTPNPEDKPMTHSTPETEDDQAESTTKSESSPSQALFSQGQGNSDSAECLDQISLPSCILNGTVGSDTGDEGQSAVSSCESGRTEDVAGVQKEKIRGESLNRSSADSTSVSSQLPLDSTFFNTSRSFLGRKSTLGRSFDKSMSTSRKYDVSDLVPVQEAETMEEYLKMCDVQLVWGKKGRQSIAPSCSFPSNPESLADFLKLSVLEFEMETLDWACSEMTQKIEKYKELNCQKEADMRPKLLELFKSASTDITAHCSRAEEMSPLCRRRVNHSFKQWRVKMVKNLLEAVEEEEQILDNGKAEIDEQHQLVKNGIDSLQQMSSELDDLEAKLMQQKESNDKLDLLESDVARSQKQVDDLTEERRDLEETSRDLQRQQSEQQEQETRDLRDLETDGLAKLDRMRSVTCWELESYDEHHMEVTFMKKSLVLRLVFGSIIPDATENSTISKRTVTDLSLKSTLPDGSSPSLVFAHKLILSTIPVEDLRNICKLTTDIRMVLLKLSKVVIEVERLHKYLTWLEAQHMATYKDLDATIRFSSLKAHTQFTVTFEFDPSSFHWQRPSISAKSVIGNQSADALIQLLDEVDENTDFFINSVTILKRHLTSLAS